MAGGPIVQVSDSGTLRPAIIAEFNRTYDARWKTRPREVADLYLEVKSTRNKEVHGGFESIPKVQRWKRGQPRSRDSFNEFFVEIQNVSWDLWVGWHEEDAEDDQTNKLLQRARSGATRFSQLDERIAIQIMTATADSDLLASIPNAYDGNPLFFGGAGNSRFGVSTGNIVTGSGVATPGAIRSDFISVVSTMRKFQDTESEPFYVPEDLVWSNFVIFFSPDNEEKFNDAFRAEIIPANPLGSAPLDNVVARNAPRLYPTQRLTGDDWYAFNMGVDLKPLVKQNRRGLRQLEQRMDNSDEGRDTKHLGVGWDSRTGYGVWEPRTAIKVDN